MSIKDKVTDAAHAVADAASHVGHKVADGATQAANFVKEKAGIGEGKDRGVAAIAERMDVIASCGTKIGVVDHVEGDAIKLTRKDSPDGQHHFIPKSWVGVVDNHVHLTKNGTDAKLGWTSDAATCARFSA